MSDSGGPRDERGAVEDNQTTRGAEGQGDLDERRALVLPGQPEDISILLSKIGAELARRFAPELGKRLYQGLMELTVGRARRTAFSVLFMVGVALTGTGLVVADRAGFMLGVPLFTFVLLFGAVLFASVTTGGASKMGWLVSPEAEYIRAVEAKSEALNRAIDEHARQRAADGASSAQIQAEIEPRRLKVFNEKVRALNALGPEGAPPKVRALAAKGASVKEKAKPREP